MPTGADDMTERQEAWRHPQRKAPIPAPTQAEVGPGQVPADLAAEHLLLPAAGNIRSRAGFVLHLQRTVGNAGVQRLLAAPRSVGRQAEPGDTGAADAGPVVDDGVAPAPGQMQRTSFLAALRGEVAGVLDAADPLTRADSHAHLSTAFADLAKQDAAGVTRSLRENLPGVEGSNAQRYLTAAGIAARAQLASDVLPAPTGVVGRVLSAVGGLVSALFKARDGVATPAQVQVLHRSLGPGQPLDAGVRAPMETSYGRNFSGVRVHTDAHAAALSDRLGARAFTVGSHIAFSPGEYQPGSLAGSALIAHELAHVGQQGDESSSATEPQLEEAADRAAVGAVVSQWTGSASPALDGAMPRLRAGLRLQRCAGSGTQVRPAGPAGQACATLTLEQWKAAVQAANSQSGVQQAAALTSLAQQALCELGITVRAAGTGHTDQVHPDDYAEVPVLNFDPALNSKKRWRTSPKQDPLPVGENVGYNFHAGARRYAIIGPKAIKEDSPFTTRQYAQHELSLVARDRQPGRTAADEELLTWTEDFRGYFHQYLQLSRRPTWTPLIGYYATAQANAKRQALSRLVDYYNNPPVPAAQKERVQDAYRMWMTKSDGALITDLDAALPARP